MHHLASMEGTLHPSYLSLLRHPHTSHRVTQRTLRESTSRYHITPKILSTWSVISQCATGMLKIWSVWPSLSLGHQVFSVQIAIPLVGKRVPSVRYPAKGALLIRLKKALERTNNVKVCGSKDFEVAIIRAPTRDGIDEPVKRVACSNCGTSV